MTTAILTTPTWTASERMKVQRERIRERQYTKIGKLTTVLIERQMSTRGMSQAKALYSHPDGYKYVTPGMEPFSEWQAKAWALMTLDWLHFKHAGVIALSADRNDLLLPQGLAPLPPIPQAGYVPKRPGDQPPRVPQKIEDRACGRIRERNGRTWLVIQPLTELCLFIGRADHIGFGRIRCTTNPADHTHMALLVDPDDRDREGYCPAFFLGGSFQAG
jgi:hypothetical protein